MKNVIKVLFVLSVSLTSSGAFAGDMGPCMIGGAAVGAVGAVLQIKGKINPGLGGQFLIVTGGCVAGSIAGEMIQSASAADAPNESDLKEPNLNNQDSNE